MPGAAGGVRTVWGVRPVRDVRGATEAGADWSITVAAESSRSQP
ncbi:hypothetical protein I551_8809 [Mycobacterium ulcerans str. Harvey]|uniref:Uncharacterized protein n=1 Tax=Mycobacterium ulcerans str. Harvey TaxID=1299332 RepID=A0ABN0RA18_MYCUL|nr:hypothetical protein I551_8809 [Mycobacterium ulcerans str. Harvey]